MKTYTPRWFPNDEVELLLTKEKSMIMKVGIDGNGIIDYLVWNGRESMWIDGAFIEDIDKNKIGFNIELNN